jgi:hypothetical protein
MHPVNLMKKIITYEEEEVEARKLLRTPSFPHNLSQSCQTSLINSVPTRERVTSSGADLGPKEGRR